MICDVDVDCVGVDVGGDVFGLEEEEFDVVFGVDYMEGFWVVFIGVVGFGEYFGGGFGE